MGKKSTRQFFCKCYTLTKVPMEYTLYIVKMTCVQGMYFMSIPFVLMSHQLRDYHGNTFVNVLPYMDRLPW